MLSDPQTVTVNAVAKVLPRIKEQDGSTTYRLKSSTDLLELTIRHSTGKITGGVFGEAHVVKVSYTLFATAVDPEKVLHTWIVIQNGDGMDLTTVKNHVLGLTGYMVAATIDRVLNGEG